MISELSGLNRQNDLDAHVLSTMHQPAINNDLISTDAISDSVGWIGGGCYLDLSPLPVGGYELALQRPFLVLTIDSLIFDAALALN